MMRLPLHEVGIKAVPLVLCCPENYLCLGNPEGIRCTRTTGGCYFEYVSKSSLVLLGPKWKNRYGFIQREVMTGRASPLFHAVIRNDQD